MTIRTVAAGVVLAPLCAVLSPIPASAHACVNWDEYDSINAGDHRSYVEDVFDVAPFAVNWEGAGDHAYTTCDPEWIAVVYYEADELGTYGDSAPVLKKSWVHAP